MNDNRAQTHQFDLGFHLGFDFFGLFALLSFSNSYTSPIIN